MSRQTVNEYRLLTLVINVGDLLSTTSAPFLTTDGRVGIPLKFIIRRLILVSCEVNYLIICLSVSKSQVAISEATEHTLRLIYAWNCASWVWSKLLNESTEKLKPNRNWTETAFFCCKILTETEPSLCTWKPSQHKWSKPQRLCTNNNSCFAKLTCCKYINTPLATF